MADLALILLYAAVGLVVGWRVVRSDTKWAPSFYDSDFAAGGSLLTYAVAWPLVVAVWALSVLGGAVRR